MVKWCLLVVYFAHSFPSPALLLLLVTVVIFHYAASVVCWKYPNIHLHTLAQLYSHPHWWHLTFQRVKQTVTFFPQLTFECQSHWKDHVGCEEMRFSRFFFFSHFVSFHSFAVVIISNRKCVVLLRVEDIRIVTYNVVNNVRKCVCVGVCVKMSACVNVSCRVWNHQFDLIGMKKIWVKFKVNVISCNLAFQVTIVWGGIYRVDFKSKHVTGR